MPIQYLLILIVLVMAAAGLTVALMNGLGTAVLAPILILLLGLRVWMARR